MTIQIEIDAIADPHAIPEPPREHEPQAGGLRILLVEDYHDSAVTLCEILNLYGHAVTVAVSFSEALEHRGEAFELLITDIGLPDGSGLDLLRELSPQRTMRSIALSGYGSMVTWHRVATPASTST